MPSCAVCTHPQRKQIEKRLAEGDSQRNVAQSFAVPPFSVHRHSKNHLAGKLESAEARRVGSVLDRVEEHLAMARRIIAEDGDAKLTAPMMAEVRKSLELIGRIDGSVPTGAQITVNLYGKLGVRDEAEARALIAEGRALREAEPEAEKDLEAALEVLASVLRAEPGRRQALAAKLARLIGAEQNDGRPPREMNNIRNGGANGAA